MSGEVQWSDDEIEMLARFADAAWPLNEREHWPEIVRAALSDDTSRDAVDPVIRAAARMMRETLGRGRTLWRMETERLLHEPNREAYALGAADMRERAARRFDDYIAAIRRGVDARLLLNEAEVTRELGDARTWAAAIRALPLADMPEQKVESPDRAAPVAETRGPAPDLRRFATLIEIIDSEQRRGTEQGRAVADRARRLLREEFPGFNHSVVAVHAPMVAERIWETLQAEAAGLAAATKEGRAEQERQRRERLFVSFGDRQSAEAVASAVAGEPRTFTQDELYRMQTTAADLLDPVERAAKAMLEQLREWARGGR